MLAARADGPTFDTSREGKACLTGRRRKPARMESRYHQSVNTDEKHALRATVQISGPRRPEAEMETIMRLSQGSQQLRIPKSFRAADAIRADSRFVVDLPAFSFRHNLATVE